MCRNLEMFVMLSRVDMDEISFIFAERARAMLDSSFTSWSPRLHLAIIMSLTNARASQGIAASSLPCR